MERNSMSAKTQLSTHCTRHASRLPRSRRARSTHDRTICTTVNTCLWGQREPNAPPPRLSPRQKRLFGDDPLQSRGPSSFAAKHVLSNTVCDVNPPSQLLPGPSPLSKTCDVQLKQRNQSPKVATFHFAEAYGTSRDGRKPLARDRICSQVPWHIARRTASERHAARSLLFP